MASVISDVGGLERQRAALESRPGRRARGLESTLGALVEAVASVTADPVERVVVVDHILRTRGARHGGRHAEVVA